jgi:hypothetical protein
MDGRLRKNTLKTVVPKRFPNGSQMVPKRFPSGSQNGPFCSLEPDLSRRLRGGVCLFAAYEYPRCCCCHISTSVHNATVLAFRAGLEVSVSYRRAGGN